LTDNLSPWEKIVGNREITSIQLQVMTIKFDYINVITTATSNMQYKYHENIENYIQTIFDPFYKENKLDLKSCLQKILKHEKNEDNINYLQLLISKIFEPCELHMVGIQLGILGTFYDLMGILYVLDPVKRFDVFSFFSQKDIHTMVPSLINHVLVLNISYHVTQPVSGYLKNINSHRLESIGILYEELDDDECYIHFDNKGFALFHKYLMKNDYSFLFYLFDMNELSQGFTQNTFTDDIIEQSTSLHQDRYFKEDLTQLNTEITKRVSLNDPVNIDKLRKFLDENDVSFSNDIEDIEHYNYLYFHYFKNVNGANPHYSIIRNYLTSPIKSLKKIISLRKLYFMGLYVLLCNNYDLDAATDVIAGIILKQMEDKSNRLFTNLSIFDFVDYSKLLSEDQKLSLQGLDQERAIKLFRDQVYRVHDCKDTVQILVWDYIEEKYSVITPLQYVNNPKRFSTVQEFMFYRIHGDIFALPIHNPFINYNKILIPTMIDREDMITEFPIKNEPIIEIELEEDDDGTEIGFEIARVLLYYEKSDKWEIMRASLLEDRVLVFMKPPQT